MANFNTFSVENLHRMRPSDIRRLSQLAETDDGARWISYTLAAYLIRLKNPTAVELDDVHRIFAQLELTKLWEKVTPSVFMLFFNNSFSHLVQELLEEFTLFEPIVEIRDVYQCRQTLNTMTRTIGKTENPSPREIGIIVESAIFNFGDDSGPSSKQPDSDKKTGSNLLNP